MGKRLLSFAAEQARRGAYARGDRGLQLVEVAGITGSVGRTAALDHRFRYRRGQAPPDAEARLRRLRELFDAGGVPPLELYRIGDDLFVVDGHHRVAVARERGQGEIEAHVVEYLPDRSDPANAVYYERLAFLHATGLRDVHASEPGRYPQLLNRIGDHRHELAREHAAGGGALVGPVLYTPPRRPPDLRQAARDWCEREYLPVVEVLAAERLSERFPGRAMGDLYGYVCDHRWYLSERRGWDVGIDAALLAFVHRHAPDSRAEALLDPVVALGSDLLDRAAEVPFGPLRRAVADVRVALVAGLLALPLAFLSGFRPRHYGFPRPGREDGSDPHGAQPVAEHGARALARERIAPVAHDNRKPDFPEWARCNRDVWRSTSSSRPAPRRRGRRAGRGHGGRPRPPTRGPRGR